LDDRKRPPYYLFLLAVYPVFALAAANPHEGIRPADLLFPALASVWFGLVSWFATGLFTRDRSKRSMVALVWIAWFAGYGYASRVLDPVAPLLGLGVDALAIPVTFAFGTGLTLWILRAGPIFKEASRALGVTSWILMVFPSFAYLSAPTDSGRAGDWSPEPLPKTSPSAATRPDIYFIVLDAYTGSRSLARNFGFDNSHFERDLRARGFFVPRHSRSNYVSTFLSLASMLNWTYLEDLPVELEERGKDRTLPTAMIENNRAMRSLKAAGYQFFFIPSAYPQTAANRYADRLVAPRGAGPSAYPEFLVAWVASTPARPLIGVVCLLARCRADLLPFQPEPAERIRWKFELLGDLAGQPGPKFVFAHLIVPHHPYVFKPDCSPRARVLLLAADSASERQIRSEYVEQVQCVNRQVLALVDRLVADAHQPPVIILQADHGHGRFPGIGNPPPLQEADPERVAERTDIFAAYYMPGAEGEAGLYDSITPINVFPAVLRHYFGASIPPLEDRIYYSSHDEPYRFTRLH
jgi:hypothetical protein